MSQTGFYTVTLTAVDKLGNTTTGTGTPKQVTLIELCTLKGVIILILGGVAYSLGAILYLIGKKKKYIHSVFHVFVLIASIFHFLFIYWFQWHMHFQVFPKK